MTNANQPTRRKFLGTVGAAGAATIAASAIGLEPLVGGTRTSALANAVGDSALQRANECARIRRDAAQAGLLATSPKLRHQTNADDEIYPNKIGSYSKGLPHNPDGTVVVSAYNALVRALSTGSQDDFNAIPLGGVRKFTNPQAGLAFDMEGPDAHSLVQPPAPAFASREEAAEIAENYWMALLRDVPFVQFDTNALAHAAAADLDSYGADFKGAKDASGHVTTATLFRGLTPGDKAGPYLSQFFYQSCNFGANKVNQKITTAQPGIDYMTDFNEWLAIQNGALPLSAQVLDPTARYMRQGRDIGQWVHIDVLFQAYFQAFLVLASAGAPVDDGNPYNGNPTQDGFGTFGGPHIAALLCEVATRALKAVWYQKWLVHRRLRPEVFAARVDRAAFHGADYPVHPQIKNSVQPGGAIGTYLFPKTGNGLLPMAFPEGSPTHPAYGAGHATVAGACVTILKAWFKETTKLVNINLAPVVPSDDGLSLAPYGGADAGQLTVGGELNKIASNVALGRNTAGVHWRSDGTESLKLGEQLAISIMREQRATYNEAFNGFSLTKFDGTTITV
jgi:hypothetical protein